MGMVVLRMTSPVVSMPILREREAMSRRRPQMCRGGLDCGTIDNSLIRVDALVGLPAYEKVGNKFEDTRIRVELLTKTISWTFDLSILESQRTFSTGSGVLRTISWQRALQNGHE